MPRDWNRLEQWFEESHEQFHPDVMKMKMAQANVRFARILPHISLHDLLRHATGTLRRKCSRLISTATTATTTTAP